jgi:alkylhydroperoxidase family enzyme
VADVRIPIVQESGATGEIAAIYDEVRSVFGMPMVPDIVKLVSIRPDFTRVLLEGYKAMFTTGGHLPREVKEMIATVVSKTNSCQY